MRLGASSAPRRTGLKRFGVFKVLIISPVVADKMCFKSGYENCEPGRGCVLRTIAPQPPASALPRVRVMLTITVTLGKVWVRLGCSLPPLGKPLVPVWKRKPPRVGGCPNRRRGVGITFCDGVAAATGRPISVFGFNSNPRLHIQRLDLKALILIKAIQPFSVRNWRKATRGRFGSAKNAR